MWGGFLIVLSYIFPSQEHLLTAEELLQCQSKCSLLLLLWIFLKCKYLWVTWPVQFLAISSQWCSEVITVYIATSASYSMSMTVIRNKNRNNALLLFWSDSSFRHSVWLCFTALNSATRESMTPCQCYDGQAGKSVHTDGGRNAQKIPSMLNRLKIFFFFSWRSEYWSYMWRKTLKQILTEGSCCCVSAGCMRKWKGEILAKNHNAFFLIKRQCGVLSVFCCWRLSAS